MLDANLPVVITEGDTDVDIFREAANRYYKNNPPVQFVSCDARPKEGGGHANLSRYIEMIPSEDGSIRIAIFDNDQVGKGSFERLKGFDSIENDPNLKKSSAGPRFATILPDRDWESEYFDLAGRPVAIEQMFPIDRIGVDLVEYKFSTPKGSLSKKKVKEISDSLGLDYLADLVECRIKITDKRLARDRIIAAPDEEYEPLNAVFLRIDKILGLCQ